MENICQNCKFFTQPKCDINNEFKSRKTEACDEFKLNKKKQIDVPKKIKDSNKSDEEIKNDILGKMKSGPECPKMKRSKTQRRK